MNIEKKIFDTTRCVIEEMGKDTIENYKGIRSCGGKRLFRTFRRWCNRFECWQQQQNRMCHYHNCCLLYGIANVYTVSAKTSERP